MADLKDANAAAARTVATAASARAPRRTGALANAIKPNRAAGKARITAGSRRVPYAGPIHWGWPARHIEGNPWASAAAVGTQSQWLPEYERDIQKILDRVRGE
jgi:hypothetical protein